ncbi:MAG: pyruvate dehydrogenase (acetyl-transferring), homodimeric type, partial [Candidatus Neomarinimicrobiota bacterium]
MENPNIREELQEWIEALENTLLSEGNEYTAELLEKVITEAKYLGIDIKSIVNPSFQNTVKIDEETPFPGDWEKEEKIRRFIRWNSLLTVLKANKDSDLGGHISTYSSAATLYEVGFNHFFRGPEKQLPDLIYFQGHSSPGIYSRAFLEGRINETHLNNFRREIEGNGLSSYPHPWLMP